jgi:hypothetical protein
MTTLDSHTQSDTSVPLDSLHVYVYKHEIECYDGTHNIPYICECPLEIRSLADLKREYNCAFINRKNGILIISNGVKTLKLMTRNLITAINTNKSYYLFDNFDIELLYDCVSKKLNVISTVGQTLYNYCADVDDDNLCIIDFDGVESYHGNSDDIVLTSKNGYAIRARRMVADSEQSCASMNASTCASMSASMNASTCASMNASMNASTIYAPNRKDIDKILILAVSNGWLDIVKSAITTDTPTKKALKKCMKIAIKSDNMEILKLCANYL